jgi:hypothetical protein
MLVGGRAPADEEVVTARIDSIVRCKIVYYLEGFASSLGYPEVGG